MKVWQVCSIEKIVGPYIFRVAKNMTKLEIKEYLTKIYKVEVTRVNTSNVLGNYHNSMLLYSFNHFITWILKTVDNLSFVGKGYRYGRSETMKEADWKKAYVYINPNPQPKEMTEKEAIEELKKN